MANIFPFKQANQDGSLNFEGYVKKNEINNAREEVKTIDNKSIKAQPDFIIREITDKWFMIADAKHRDPGEPTISLPSSELIKLDRDMRTYGTNAGFFITTSAININLENPYKLR